MLPWWLRGGGERMTVARFLETLFVDDDYSETFGCFLILLMMTILKLYFFSSILNIEC